MLFTIGYEGSKIDGFTDSLKMSEIDLLLDVRELPLSRKPGFSKSALTLALNNSGIEYLHFRTLGAPKVIRDALKQTGNWAAYKQSYSELLLNRNSKLEEIAFHSSAKNVCLMCFENDYRECHRSLITERLEELGYVSEVVHHLNPLVKKVDPVALAR